MPESNEVFAEISIMRERIEDIGHSVSALVRESGLKSKILAEMSEDNLLAEIFLLVDGIRTQGDIVIALGKNGSKDVSQPTVSRRMVALEKDWDLIRPTMRNAAGTRFVHTTLAKALKIERALTKLADRTSNPRTLS